MERIAAMLKEACEGLLSFLIEMKEEGSSSCMRSTLKQKMAGMQEMDWLVPPMLSRQ